MISSKRYAIAQAAEKNSHILKSGINVFDKRLNSARQVALPFIHSIEKEIGRSGLHILDLGSGPTCLGRFFQEGNKTYLDPLMDFFKDYYPDKLPEDGELLTGRGEELHFAAGSFDVIFCYNALDHAFNPRKIVAEVERVLKPGGFLLLGIYAHGPVMKVLRVLAEKSWVFKERPHPYSFRIGEILKLLEPGFKIRECQRIRGVEKFYNLKRRFYMVVAQKKSAAGNAHDPVELEHLAEESWHDLNGH